MEEKQIVLLNDTVATLLAGKSASFGREYDYLWVIFWVQAQIHVTLKVTGIF